MTLTHVQHAAYALLMQAIVGLLTWNAWTGALFAIAFFLGREHAQAQRNYQLGDLAAFDVRRWELDAQLDIAFPVAVVVAAALLV